MPGPAGDPGLQAERTRLAWSRTALATAASGTLLLHAGGAGAGLPGYLPGALVLICAAVLRWCGARRYRFVNRALREGRPVTEPRLMRLAGALCLVPGLAALIRVLLG